MKTKLFIIAESELTIFFSTIIIFYFNPVVGYLHMVGMTYSSSNLACSVTRSFLCFDFAGVSCFCEPAEVVLSCYLFESVAVDV